MARSLWIVKLIYKNTWTKTNKTNGHVEILVTTLHPKELQVPYDLNICQSMLIQTEEQKKTNELS